MAARDVGGGEENSRIIKLRGAYVNTKSILETVAEIPHELFFLPTFSVWLQLEASKMTTSSAGLKSRHSSPHRGHV